ncbi:putative NAD-dependent deacylase [Clavispora lusitaniae]|uniref:NAD-dependent protein deacylase n=2 Tax=Clavispora lusitaniae TaxID=36911 RepID=C4Y4Q6_CLAL4|nr:uncharacterized protein CLUG_02628 [Clavispora lusitaniae ATCC 42720]KAF7580106.1 Sir2 family protein [Clavispora lusitaniae]EEQ38502.1 hypothetical protein CLUG_02628 [Clavispora lusitaniae ATCC 42720]QFZ27667.1 putative NAD-dependent deacylase [Clavispora lusitaniae]QFZ33026.1 putative NAD-dependent deacylase [Clavispora lusitaniae]QFZ38696.1 putative NAD-dependent deacylase [Clavispora lusitaniae]
MSTQLSEFQECLRSSKRIVALVGAGLSASSGLATFRGSQGLWKNFNMIDLATPDAFYIDPGLVWQFYSWRRYEALKAQPNAGHLALARLSRLRSKKFITITQNVDGLSARGGHDPKTLYEIHGSLFELRCTSFTCTHVERGNTDVPLTPALTIDVDTEVGPSVTTATTSSASVSSNSTATTTATSSSPFFSPTKELNVDDLPKCPVCQSLMRPGVVWFGESLPLRVLDRIDTFLEAGPVDLILVIGTSGTVYPANSYVDIVRQRGGSVAIFNTDIDQDVLEGKVAKTWGFKGDAAELLLIALSPLFEDSEEANS